MNCLGGEYLVSVKKDMAAQLQFAKLYPYKTKVKKKKSTLERKDQSGDFRSYCTSPW